MDVRKILAEMPLKEKIALCSGADEWHTKAFPQYGIPSVMMSDGPHGLRKQTGAGDMMGLNKSVPATSFPTASLTACSFDEKLIGEMSAAIAVEAGANGVAMFLGPGVNIKRNPLCGRNFEYFSEDPYLAGKLAASYIRSAQALGIGTSLKHFACNDQEYFRMISNSLVDERTLREIYLTAFEIAVKQAQPASVMAAYNRINGTFCTVNKRLLKDVLRNEWGYRGFVVTDWLALADRRDAFEAGCDLVMPGGNAYGEKEALRDVQSGALAEEAVDQSAERILRWVFQADEAMKRTYAFDQDEHHALARRIAEESAVLLKNDDRFLPCDPSEIAIIGLMAEDLRYQGYGSSHINPVKLDQVRDFLPDAPYAPGYLRDGSTTEDLLRQAAEVAKTRNKVLVFAGLPDTYETEGIDRAAMRMPDSHNRLIEAVAAANPNVAVVLFCGSAVETPWADHVKAILYMGLSGQAGAGSAVRLLTGSANPCGKLAETWPLSYADCPSSGFYAGSRNAEYREGIYVGYRYYDKAGVAVRFLFGHGLSYTTFAYGSLTASQNEARVTVTNTGGRSGGEAVLLYVRPPQDGIHRPLRELKGFEKVFLQPGESKEVVFALDERSFAVWDGGWKVFAGSYGIEIGGLQTRVEIRGEEPSHQDGGWYDRPTASPKREDWLRSLGHEPKTFPVRPYTVDSTILELSESSRLIRLIYRIFERKEAKTFGRGTVEYQSVMKSAQECPLRAAQCGLNLKIPFAQAMADIGNGKFLTGLGKLLKR